MNAFYDITTKIREHLLANPSINTVTEGDIFEVDLSKQTIFPLAHMDIGTATLGEHTITFNINILFMDVVDISKDDPRDGEVFYGVDNRHDILNTMLYAANDLVAHLQRGDLYTDKYQVAGTPTAEPFQDRFENLLAGWNLGVTVEIPNTISKCQ